MSYLTNPQIQMNQQQQTITFITSPSTKLQAKEAAHNRFKYGSPKLRDLLREQCRIRFKERRNKNFLGKRNLMQVAEERSLIENVVKQGISEFENDLALQDLIYKEIQDEFDQWLIEEINFLSELEFVEDIFCPLCQKCSLSQQNNLIGCASCGFLTNLYSDLCKLGDKIRLVVLQHDIKCSKNVVFYKEPVMVDPYSWRINVICDECDFLSSL